MHGKTKLKNAALTIKSAAQHPSMRLTDIGRADFALLGRVIDIWRVAEVVCVARAEERKRPGIPS